VSPSSAAKETIRVEAANRWDAVDLAQRLGSLHTYLVQLGDRRWHVCVRPEGHADELLPLIRDTAEAWARERQIDHSIVRVGDRAFDVGEPLVPP
jgi:uncharacterized protein (DUF2252 family)